MLINIFIGAEKPSVTWQVGVGEGTGSRQLGEAGLQGEQMKTRAQGAKTDDKYALTSNRDSERDKGRLTEKGIQWGICTGEACAKTCKSPSKQF